jgi:uncharacterized membrane protein
MGRSSPATALVVLILAINAGSVAASYALLPAKVASHFNAAGLPDAWESRDVYLSGMALVCLGVPLFLLAIFWSVCWLPDSMVNVPNREYWLSPERQPQTARLMFEFGQWFAVLQGLFFLLLHWLVVAANRQAPVQLSWLVWPALVVYLMLVSVWLWQLLCAFRLPIEWRPAALSSGAKAES